MSPGLVTASRTRRPGCEPHSDAPTAIAASSPLASWSDHGIPARPQYSSVSRGSNMRRKLTFPVEPPVAMMTALRARMSRPVPLVVDRDPERRGPPAPRGGSPSSGARAGSARPPARRNFQRPHQAVAGRERSRADAGSAGLPVWTIGQSIDGGVHFARHGIADRCRRRSVGRLVDEDDAMRDEPLERRGAVVGEGAHDLAIVVAIVGEAVRLDDRPVGQVAEERARANRRCRVSSARWCRRRAERCRRW